MEHIDIVKKILLDPAGLDERNLSHILSNVLSTDIDLADIYFQSIHQETWELEDGVVKYGSFAVNQGVGIRAISGEKTGYAYCDDFNPASLEKIALAARSICKLGQNKVVAVSSRPESRAALYRPDSPLEYFSEAEKIAILNEVNAEAYSVDPRIKRVEASLSGSYEVILIIDNTGNLIPDVRPLVRLDVMVVAEDNGRIERASYGGGGRHLYNAFREGNKHLFYAREAARQALVNLNAIPAPAGMMTVVLGPGWPGVLLHEAIGHGLEGDFNRKGSSVFSGKIGERVATPECTVVDNGAIAGRRGSLNVDDEGTLTRETVLIENGILRGYLQDKLNARLMGMEPTGNGRRESYAYPPLPRMTNTYMLAGKHAPEEIIKSVEKGLYAVNFQGGQVDITSGKFVFSAAEAYLIENGKITHPVKGATFIGDGPSVLTKVSMVGNDLELDAGIGTCGKDGQQLPVGVGQPTLKIDELVVGGTN